MQQLRFGVAFLLAPALLSAVICMPLAVPGGFTRFWLELFLLPTLALTLGHSLVFGVPIALRLHRTGRLTLRRTLLAGAFIGGVPLTLFSLGSGLLHSTGWFGFEVNPEVGNFWSGAFVLLALATGLALLGALGAGTWWASSNNRWRGP
jgi:hypothetical protein